jgi:hypothetical protein
MTLALDEFLRRFLLRLPQGFVRIPPLWLPRQPPARRSLTALLSRTRHKYSRRAGKQEPPLPQKTSPLRLCPKCVGPMVVIERLTAAPTPTPLSTSSDRRLRMKLPFQAPLLGAPHHLSPWCALRVFTPPARFQSRLKVSPRPTQTPTQPTLPALLLTLGRPPGTFRRTTMPIEFA